MVVEKLISSQKLDIVNAITASKAIPVSPSATFVAGQTKMLLWLQIQDNQTLA